MNTTWEDVARKRVETRAHARSSTAAAVGRSKCRITCPFCGAGTTAYVWSLSGGGKRCPGCGAMHDSMGQTHRRKS